MSSHRLTDEEIKQGQRAAKNGRKWYKRLLLDIVEGKVTVTSVQLAALKQYSDAMGFIVPKRKVNPLNERPRKPKPAVTDDLATRLNQASLASATQTPQYTHFNGSSAWRDNQA